MRAANRRLLWFSAGATAILISALLLGPVISADPPRRLYPPALRALAWQVGWQERAYKFSTVVPGRIYRSGKPDERFMRYLHETHGIRSIINLTSKHGAEFEQQAAALGIRIHHIPWAGWPPPPDEELVRVLDLMESEAPVLVHCSGGKDRTGYAIAAYRIFRQNWEPAKAFGEMHGFHHDSAKHWWYQAKLRDWATTSQTAPVGLIVP